MADDIPDLISAEHTRAIGLLVLAISVIETRVTDVLTATLGLQVVEGVAAFHHQQLSGRLDTLISLLDLHLRKPKGAKEGEFAPIFDTLNKAKKLAEYRNTLVHAAWITDDDGKPMSVRFSARGEFLRSRATQDIGEIHGRVREANGIAVNLEALAASFRE